MADDTETPTPFKLTLTGNGVKIERELDAEKATEVMTLVMGGRSTGGGGSGVSRSRSSGRRQQTARKRTEGGGDEKPRRKRRGSSPGIVKNLSMRPSGKTSLVEFVEDKQPKYHNEKQTVILHWLTHEAGLAEGVTVDHVNTCYVEAKWARPADLENNLQVNANKKGWLDTSDMENIKLTTRGEDLVQHELPRGAKK